MFGVKAFILVLKEAEWQHFFKYIVLLYNDLFKSRHMDFGFVYFHIYYAVHALISMYEIRLKKMHMEKTIRRLILYLPG